MNILLFVLAAAQAALALMIWHKSMPRLLEARGRAQGLCAWTFGMILAIESGILITLAFAGDQVGWLTIARDGGLCVYGLCRYRWSLTISTATWRNYQLKGAGPCRHDPSRG